jgi:hypothetical protein
MKIICGIDCGGTEFEVIVLGRVRLTVSSRGEVHRGMADVVDASLPTVDNQYQCISCGAISTPWPD